MDLKLGGVVKAELLAERDREVAALLKRAEELKGVSPEEFLARGLRCDELESAELIKRMYKRGWARVEYDECTPGWRVLSIRDTESYVSEESVNEVFGGEG